MKVSIITPTFNSSKTIKDCIDSIKIQSYPLIEHIVVDGGSTDNTIELVKKHGINDTKLISEKDNGIYDALNKGIKKAAGDIVGILHSDDFYAYKDVIKDIVEVFTKEKIDSCYTDLCYVSALDTKRIKRYWKAGAFDRKSFRFGWMPPHPTFFVKKTIYYQHGFFDLSYNIAADYELMIRFLYKNQISTFYLPKVIINMRAGGKSNRNLKNILIKMYQDYKIIRKHGLGNIDVLFFKNIRKITQFLIST